MRSVLWIALAIVAGSGFHGAAASRGAEPVTGFKVPAGFKVSLYADDHLATDIFSMTLDAQGRVVVAGKGYIKILHDTNRDGVADRATLFSPVPKSGAHGMYFDGPDLIANGDNGIRRYRDVDGDGVADTISPVWLPVEKDSEHGANGILRGPDGWFYLIAGNDTGISAAHAKSPGSPVKQPHQGALVRFLENGAQAEVLADGLRNPYDLAFNDFGQLFTVDADGERIFHLPYYSPTRLFDLAQGRHHGWILPGWQRCWGRPGYWPDSVPRLVEIGRGSPTGVAVYRHHRFPARYRAGVFSACWSFGRVYFMPLERSGASYRSGRGGLETFLETTGDIGFAPVDMVVSPEGDLLVAIGGRGTRGSVFRIHYSGELPDLPARADPLHQVLSADEPLSSWSRARWTPAAKKLGRTAFVQAVQDSRVSLRERVRAVEILTELFGGLDIPAIQELQTAQADPELLARAIWSLARSQPDAPAQVFLRSLTSQQQPCLARAAWEGVMTLPPWDEGADFKMGLEHSDRRIRAAALQVARGAGRRNFETLLRSAPLHSPAVQLAELWVRGIQPRDADADVCLKILTAETAGALRLEAVRLLQIMLGDVVTQEGPDSVFIGYAAQAPEKVPATLRRKLARHCAAVFPTRDTQLNSEIARLLGMLSAEVAGLPEKIARLWPTGSVEEDIHYLFVTARLPVAPAPEATRQTAVAVHGIYVQLAAQGAKPSDQVPTILEELLDRLLRRDPSLAEALATTPGFGLPGEELLALHLPETQRRQVTQQFLALLATKDEEQADLAWSGELVRLVAALPDRESLPVLRAQFHNPRLMDAIAMELIRRANPADRGRFIEALGSLQGSVVQGAAQVLATLQQGGKIAREISPREISFAVRALRRYSGRSEEAVRLELRKLLVIWAGETPAGAKSGTTPALAQAWQEWFSRKYPVEAAALSGFSGANAVMWKKRIDGIDWSHGDVKRGFAVFQKRNCFRCHGETKRIGPELRGVAQRFSASDLFSHIVEPSKDVSPAYQTRIYLTHSGKSYAGIVVYDSQEVTLLQITPDQTVRLQQSDVALVQPSTISFMPTGLLDEATDAELADLYSYLKSLRK